MLELETNFVEHGTMEIYTKDLDCGENMLHLEMDQGKISAAVQNDDGSFTVKPEYMTQLAKITTPEILEAFLKNAFVKIKQLDNGDFKFEVNQKANGGMNGSSYLFAKQHFSSTYQASNDCFTSGVKGAVGGAAFSAVLGTNPILGAASGAFNRIQGSVESGKCTITQTKPQPSFWNK